MITLQEAIRAWKYKTPVIFDHPGMIHPLECRIGQVEFSKSRNELVRLTLIQPPTAGSYIKADPSHVFLKEDTGIAGKLSDEVRQALDELGKLRDEGYEFD